MRNPFDTEVVFVTALAAAMASAGFVDIRADPIVVSRDGRRLRPDIIAKRESDGKTVVVECKNLASITIADAQTIITQLKAYAAALPGAVKVLAIPARVPLLTQIILEDAGIEIWNADRLLIEFDIRFADEVPPQRRSEAEKLLSELTAPLPAGRDTWSIYQKLVGRTLAALFCPPLEEPVSESSDASGVNRRDFILENLAENGFWHLLRTRYAADYIVVDAKNYTQAVKKRDILQIANYLKRHGAGLFGIIFFPAKVLRTQQS